ncbi:hypothetical protein GCM10011348_27320 [Marinobacterium nitratireducens]|uniref:SnoaL-like domain-containing protein n=2 Tax=Marinobacterium nitratireducens TaxID=518897 RepID=A0A917ZI03_9GAMM|nr:hypothetical protein GCM10011348_27320 [Marinobacterium nitratireducens]
MTLLTDSLRDQVERSCTRLILDSADCADRQDYTGLAALFTPDARLYRPTAPDTPLEGRAAILDSYQSRPRDRITRHICSNIRVTVESAERARVLTYVQIYATANREGEGDPLGPAMDDRLLVGEFEDECVAGLGGWYIAARKARFVMHRDL